MDIIKKIKSERNFIIVCVISVTFFFVILFLFTRPPVTVWFGNTGQIADTINGLFITPIIGLLGVYWIYRTFKQQQIINDQQIQRLEEQNKQQLQMFEDQTKRSTAQFDFNSYYDIFKNLKDEYELWGYQSIRLSKTISGKEGLLAFSADLQNYEKIYYPDYMKTLDDVNYFVEILLSVVLSVRNSKSLNIETRSLLVTLLITFYSKKMDKELRILNECIDRIGEELLIKLLKQNIEYLHKEIVGARDDVYGVRMSETNI